MPEVTPDAKKAIEEAYATFQAKLKTIAHEHRITVGALLTQLDQKHVQALDEQIKQSKDL